MRGTIILLSAALSVGPGALGWAQHAESPCFDPGLRSGGPELNAKLDALSGGELADFNRRARLLPEAKRVTFGVKGPGGAKGFVAAYGCACP